MAGELRLILSILRSVSLLLKHGATLDPGSNGDSPLQWAWQIAIYQWFLFIQLLLNNASSKNISIEYLEREVETDRTPWGYGKIIEMLEQIDGYGICKWRTCRRRGEVNP